MASVKLKLHKNRLLQSGCYPLVFQIIHLRVRRLIYTPYRISEDEFDAEGERVVCSVAPGRHSQAQIRGINREIRRERAHIEEAVRVLSNRYGYFTAGDIVARCKGNFAGRSLLNCFDECIERKSRAGNYGIAAAYGSTRTSLLRFCPVESPRLQDVDHRFLHDYEQFMTRNGLSANTVCFHMRNFKAVYNTMVTDGFEAPSGIFEGVRTSPRKTVKRALEIDDIRRLQRLDLSGLPRLALARDLFLFSFYTRGMPLVDIAYLEKRNIVEGVISYRRKKTGQWLYVRLAPPAERIVGQYANDSGFVFPLLTDSDPEVRYEQYRNTLRQMNLRLREIGRMLEFAGPLTTYVARHSWATAAKRSGVPIAAISEGLGHSSESITRIYLKQFDRQTLDTINDGIVGLI